MNEVKSPIVDRLRAAREHSGLSQGQVAKLLGYHRPTISEIEAGRRRVTADELMAFARIYEVSVDWLTSKHDEADAVVELAARQLSKLRKEDLDRVIRLITSIRNKANQSKP